MSIFSSTFDQADSTTLPAGWTEVSGDLATVGNRLRMAALETAGFARFESDVGSDDMFSEATITGDIGADSDSRLGLWVRFATAAITGYRMFIRNRTVQGFEFFLFRTVAGSSAELASGALPITFTPGSRCQLEVEGTSPCVIRGWAKGTRLFEVSDSDAARIQTGQRGGIETSANIAIGNGERDNFRVGALADIRPSPAGPPFSEDFITADQMGWGPRLRWRQTHGSFSIADDQGRSTDPGSADQSRAEHDVGSSDMYAQCRISIATRPTSGGNEFVVECRYDPNGYTKYYAIFEQSPLAANDALHIGRNVGGTPSHTTFTGTEYTVAPGDIIRIEAEGTGPATVRALIDRGAGFVLLESIEDVNDLSTFQRGAVELVRRTSGDARIDQFETGALEDSSPGASAGFLHFGVGI